MSRVQEAEEAQERMVTATDAAAASPAAAAASPTHPYHHGALRVALITTALQMLEAGETFSLRALARRAGVSAAAPYRHFPDKQALETALAVEGMRELMGQLTRSWHEPATAAGIGELAVVYVRFALRRPALFRLMFGQPCDTGDDERVRAACKLQRFLTRAVAEVSAVPGDAAPADTQALATAVWSLAHGLAFLHLDGKFDAADQLAVDRRVRCTFAALLPGSLGVGCVTPERTADRQHHQASENPPGEKRPV